MKTPTRIAVANAVAFIVAWTLFFLVRQAMAPDRGWKNEGEDEMAIGFFLFFSITGASVVFWRVRSAYSAGTVSIYRAMVEGTAGAVASYYVLCAGVLSFLVVAFDFTWQDIRRTSFNGDFMDGLIPVLYVARAGIIFAVVVWLANAYALSRTKRTQVDGSRTSSMSV
jgi:hypothetical protein